MRVLDRTIYADEGKLLDFKEPRYALDEDKVDRKTIREALDEDKGVTQVHLYTPSLRMGRMDKPENYIEVNEEDIEE